MDNALTQTYKIPSENLPGLQEHIEKLNKKVEKLAKKGHPVTPLVLVVDPKAIVEEKVHTFPNGEQRTVERIYFTVTLTGVPVKVDGWQFIATLQHEDGGTIVRAVPGMTTEGELAPFRNVGNVCNHCGFDRKRNDTFVVRKVS
jgi:hypothetical protein